ncbi:GNAT family N-acetyltransferase [Xenorhabdus bovienii]|uniref:Putative acetyltransferase n=1 Tax=Xenorhabdus bovienii str. feltiae Moldova TaxID=1398200 RepID=A0A077NCG9_XENBV|nr:GNAT family N-acetyltransferase [Xenorhabdus bovienii]CDG99867.1 putative acetyltransferase [Xenorhabdus bovienii str. feltiae Moldova]
MIELREMTTAEFKLFRLLFINEHALDLASTRGYPADVSLKKASQLIDVTQSQVTEKVINKFWCIVKSAHELPVIGYLWIELQEKAAWVCDFRLLPEWCRKGLGKAALDKMKSNLMSMGITEVGLRVAPNNPVAKALYEKSGFHITGFNMSKTLS